MVREPAWERVFGRIEPLIFTGPAVALVAIFLLWPLLWTVGMSFTSWDGLGPIHWAGAGTWTSLFSDPAFVTALEHSAIWIALSATVPVTLGFLLAVLFSRSGPIIGPLARAVAVVPLLLPATVVAVTWKIIYNPAYGPLDGVLGSLGLPQPDWLGSINLAFWSVCIVGVWSSVGLSVLLFTAALRSIDATYFDQAKVEGASFLQEARAVLIPACVRTAGLALIVTVVITSQVADLLYVLTNGGPGNATVMLPLDMFGRVFFGTSLNVSQGIAEAAIQVGIGLLLAWGAMWLSTRHPGMAGEGEYDRGAAKPIASLLAAIVALLLVLPLGWDLIAAFANKQASVLSPLAVHWPPVSDPFASAWNAGIGSGLGQSAVIAAVVVILTLAVSLPAGFWLATSRASGWIRGVILAVLVVTLLQPGEATLIPLFYLLQQLGLGDTAIGLVLTEAAREIPFATLLLWISMRALPADIIGAGELDAGRGFRLLLRVVAPLAAPAAAATSLWVFITSWSEYTLPTILLSNSTLVTAPMALRAFAGTHDTEFNLLAAGTLLLIAPVIVLLVLAYGPAARGLRTAGRSLAI